MRVVFLAALMLLLVPVIALADVIHMRDGRKLEGEIVEEKEETITLKMKYGTITLRRSDIERIKKTRPAEKQRPQPEKTPDETQKETPPAEKQEPPKPPEKPRMTPEQLNRRVRKFLRKLTGSEIHGSADTARKALVEIGAAAVDSLIEELKDSDDRRASSIARVFGEIGDQRAVGPVLGLLKRQRKKFSSVHSQAIKALGSIGSKEAVEPLIKILTGEDKPLRRGAAEALGKLGDKKAVASLLEFLKAEHADDRHAAAVALAEIGDKSVLPALRKLWKQEERIPAKLAVAYALAKMAKDREGLDYLIESLGQIYYQNRAYAADFLGRLKEKKATELLVKMLAHSRATDGLSRMIEEDAVFDAVVQIGKPAVRLLLDILKNDSYDRKNSAVGALGMIKDKSAVEPLIKILKDPESRSRGAAARALGSIGDSRALQPLLEALKDKDKYMRRTVAFALGLLGDRRAAKALVEAANHKECFNDCAVTALEKMGEVDAVIATMKDKDAKALRTITRSLGKMGDGKAVAPLARLLESDSREIRRAAIEALTEIPTDNAIDALAAALGHEDGAVSDTAFKALGDSFNPWAVKPLVKALESDYLEAAQALGNLGESSAVEALAKAMDGGPRDMRTAVIGALGKIGGDRAVELVIPAVDDKHPQIRSAAFRALGTIGSSKAVKVLMAHFSVESEKSREARDAIVKVGEKAVKPLIETLESDSSRIRAGAAHVLGRIKDHRAIDPLIKLLKDPDVAVRRSTAVALGNIGHKKAIEPLIELLKEDDRALRQAADKALASITNHYIGYGATYEKWKQWWDKNKHKY